MGTTVRGVVVAMAFAAALAAGVTPAAAAADRLPVMLGVAACRANGPAPVLTPSRDFALTAREEADGRRVFRLSGPGFDATKSVSPDGTSLLRLEGVDDRVEVNATPSAVAIARGGREVRVDFARPDGRRLGEVASLLAGSRALRLFRDALHGLRPDDLATDGAFAMQLGDALVRIAQGDAADALTRLRSRLLQASPAPADSPEVSHGAATIGGPAADQGEEGCFDRWTREVDRAWSDYVDCFGSVRWWTDAPEACALIYVVQVEVAWFRMLSCAGFRAR
jgi:hypothetical protein